MSTKPVLTKDAFKVLSGKLDQGNQYLFKELKHILIDNFEGINTNQASSIINRAYTRRDGILVKEGKYCSLRATAKESTNRLEEAKYILEDALKKIEKIPTSSIETIEQFNELIKIRTKLNEFIGEHII